jgi:hypothetical protein
LDLETAVGITEQAPAIAMAAVDERDSALFCLVPTPLLSVSLYSSNQPRIKHKLQAHVLVKRPEVHPDQ